MSDGLIEYRAMSIPLKHTALHHQHLALGAAMMDDSGWQRPERYGPSEEELKAVREGVGLCDISPVDKLDLKGKQIAPVFELLFSLSALPQIGHVQRLALSNTNSMSGIEGSCCRLGSDHVLLLTETGTLSTVEQAFTQQMKATDECLHLTNLTSVLAAVQLVGPDSRELLRKLTALDLSPQRFVDLTCAQGSVAKVHALVVRADLGPELAYEVYCGREFGEYLWDTLRDAGQEFGAVPFGVATQRLLRAEK
jgi:sarcosine oxidase subunit alpha